MIFATAGHVDHGKTSLVKALTGIDTDRLQEEKDRGLTIDLGFAYWQRGEKTIGFVDVPGHQRFITNMLAGVSAIDHALLVIAADDGPMPQTREHIAILDLLMIQQATVVITKIDRVTSKRLSEVEREIQELLSTTIFATAQIFTVSSTTGSGLEVLADHLWSLTSRRILGTDQYFRLAIDRRFNLKGSGLVVTGSVFSGEVKVGDELNLMPQGKKVRVREIRCQNEAADIGKPGDRCAINIAGSIEMSEVQRGDWLTSHPRHPSSARLDVLVKNVDSKTIRTGTSVHVHIAAHHTTARLFFLDSKTCDPGQLQLAQLVTDEPLVTVFGDRFVIRDRSASNTIAGGQIIDPFSVQRGRSKPDRLRYLNWLSQPERQSTSDFLESYATGLNLETLADIQNRISDDSTSYVTDETGVSFHPRVIHKLEDRLLTIVSSEPQTAATLKQQLAVNQSCFKLLTDNLRKQQKVEIEGGRYRPWEQSPLLPPATDKLWQKIEPVLTAAGLQPPVLSDLAKQMSLPVPAVEKLLTPCVKAGLVTRAVKNRYFANESLQELRTVAKTVASNHDGKFSVIQFRDHTGLGRNLCIELLEHLDSKGFTKRLGDQRVIQDESR